MGGILETDTDAVNLGELFPTKLPKWGGSTPQGWPGVDLRSRAALFLQRGGVPAWRPSHIFESAATATQCLLPRDLNAKSDLLQLFKPSTVRRICFAKLYSAKKKIAGMYAIL